MTGQHGTRTRYNAGCRCEPCKVANAEYAKQYAQVRRAEKVKPGAVTSIRAAKSAPKAAPSPESAGPGEVEAAVIAELAGLSTAGSRPGLMQVAISLARVLDTPSAVAQHASAAHRLSETLDKLRKGADAKSSKLAAVRQMTRRPAEATG